MSNAHKQISACIGPVSLDHRHAHCHTKFSELTKLSIFGTAHVCLANWSGTTAWEEYLVNEQKHKWKTKNLHRFCAGHPINKAAHKWEEYHEMKDPHSEQGQSPKHQAIAASSQTQPPVQDAVNSSKPHLSDPISPVSHQCECMVQL